MIGVILCAPTACRIKLLKAPTISDACVACGRPGGITCWGCGQVYHDGCVSMELGRKRGSDWLCAGCYMGYASSFHKICSSERWLGLRRKQHVSIQRLLVEDARPYGDRSAEGCRVGAEWLQHGKGPNMVSDLAEGDGSDIEL